MGTFGIWQWIIVLVIVLLLFGRGRIPELMGDAAKGIRNFRKGLKDDNDDTNEDGDDTVRTVEHKSDETAKPVNDAVKKG